MNYILSLNTQSFVLPGSGEGGVLIDADVVYHRSGFPLIPARRIKGMLKESVEEVMEISGESIAKIETVLNCLFGQSGATTYEGKLLFANLMWKEWREITQDLKQYPSEPAFQPDVIKSQCTQEIQQTALNEKGIALDKSLRNYRAIKPDCTFESELTVEGELTTEEETYLQRAIQHLRRIGTRRNRGFGQVVCTLTPLQEADRSKEKETTQLSSSPIEKVNVVVRTLSPVVLADMQGEQNTVFTQKSLTGNQVRGLLANAFIREKGLGDAHKDDGFFTCFLEGNLNFGTASFENSQPIPSHIHRYKYHEEKAPISVFSKEENDQEITKTIGGRGAIDGTFIQKEGTTPSTTFNFHNSREHRAAGRNKEDDNEGGIFYYESLDEDQVFLGEITGDPKQLRHLLEAFPVPFEARLGRSRSAQYGKVQVGLSPVYTGNQETEDQKGKEESSLPADQLILLSLRTPLVLFNEHGFPSPTEHAFCEALESELSSQQESRAVQVEIKKATVGFSQVEQFNSIWKSKSGKTPAIREGSTFLLKLSSSQEILVPGPLGEWAEQGFGQWEWEVFEPNQEYSLAQPTDDAAQEAAQESVAKEESPALHLTSKPLQDVLNSYDREIQELTHKKLAIQKAVKASRNLLNNHLIGRLERLFLRSKEASQIARWIKETQGKPAGDALRKAHLVDDNHKFDLRQHDGVSTDWQLQQLYWTTFFQTLRKMNKRHGR